MAQTTILAAGQTAANATDVVVASGGTARLSIRGASELPKNICLAVVEVIDTTESNAAYQLDWINQSVQVGAGTWRVKRPDIAAYGVDVTVTSDA
jgi:hypothetical protein